MTVQARQGQPLEISIQARLCDVSQVHSVGDLLPYRSGMWVVKGCYFGPAQSGERELYYILAEATALTQFEGV